jgi:hypothetical protein
MVHTDKLVRKIILPLEVRDFYAAVTALFME